VDLVICSKNSPKHFWREYALWLCDIRSTQAKQFMYNRQGGGSVAREKGGGIVGHMGGTRWREVLGAEGVVQGYAGGEGKVEWGISLGAG